MSKYCPSCGTQNNDLLQNCWRCGQYIGRGKIDELATMESARKVQSDLQLDRRDDTVSKNYMDTSESDIGLVTIYGVTRKDLDQLLTKHNLTVDHAEMPGLCTKDEMISQSEMRRQEQTPKQNQNQNQNRNYSGSGSSYYYYDDPSTDICCYYGCYPRRRYYAYSGSNSTCCGPSSSNSNCDCNDSGSDSDDFAAIAVILLVIAAIALLIFMGPSIIAFSAIALEGLMSVIILLFNIVTLGVFRDDLSRNRIRIRQANHDDLNNFLLDIVNKRGLPRMPGYWTQGFIMIRYGAVFLMSGIILFIAVIAIGGINKYLALPTGIIVISLAGFLLGEYLIKTKVAEVRRHLQ